MDNFQVNTGVNTVPRKQPMSPDPIGLTMPPRELDREHANLAGSTFNPKVAGSIPARPIASKPLARRSPSFLPLCAHLRYRRQRTCTRATMPLVVLASGTGAINAVLLASAVVPPLVAVLVARVAWIWAKSDDEGETLVFRDLLRRALWLERPRATRSSPP
jgi:hypothetical protein